MALISTVHAEVEWVRIYWDPASTTESAYPVLERRLNGVSGVAKSRFNFVDGEATLRWKPHHPYNDRGLRTAVAWTGIKVEAIAIRLRGTVVHDEKNTYIASLGDTTQLPLVSALAPEKGRYTKRQGRGDLHLEDRVTQRLREAEAELEVVTVEGMIHEPYRPPIQLKIDRITYPREL